MAVRLWRLAGSLLLLALALGVGNAGGRGVAATPVLIEVIGAGKVTGPGVDCGRGARSCYATFSSSGTVTLTATVPAGDWSFAGWGGPNDTDCAGSPATTCTVALDGNSHQITATFATASSVPTRTLSVAVPNNSGGKVKGGKINCGSGPSTACTWEVLDGSTLSVIESPDAGFLFTGWGGDCTGSGPSCIVPMTGDKSATASFSSASTPRTLTVTVVGNGTVSGGGINCSAGSTCSSAEPVGSFVTLNASPGTDSNFGSWTGDCTGTGSTCTVQMTADRKVTATFELTYPLSVTVTGNGTVTGGPISCGSGASICSANLPANSAVTLTALPTGTASFSGWGGACAGLSFTCTVTMTAAKSVTATFTGTPPPSLTYPLSVSVSGNGNVTGGGINCGGGGSVCGVNVASGSRVVLTATPTGGATFSGWGGACSGTSPTCALTITAATGVSATFAGGGTSTFRLSVSVRGSGKVTGSLIACGAGFTVCEANQPANSTVTLTATAVSGATFQGWGGACSGASKTCQVLMNSLKVVSAQFTAPPPKATLTLRVVGKGTVGTPAGKCVSRAASRTCVQVFSRGRAVTLTATPAKNHTFLGWTGACTGKKRVCTVLLTRSRLATATFSR